MYTACTERTNQASNVERYVIFSPPYDEKVFYYGMVFFPLVSLQVMIKMPELDLGEEEYITHS